MQFTSLAEWNCSIARTLDVVGEWWTLLIVRDAFRGTKRFDDFQASLGMARSVLTARLRKLTDRGHPAAARLLRPPASVRVRPHREGAGPVPRHRGADLHWGDTWAPSPGGPPVVFIHDTCGNVTQPMLTCPHCHGEVTTANTRSEPGPGSRRVS